MDLIFEQEEVKQKFLQYPDGVREKMLYLRSLVFDTVAENSELGPIQETLKWGEPSYLCKNGSTLRMDWKSKQIDQVALYFHCQTNLIETFREIYTNVFHFDGKRAIIFQLDQTIPENEIKQCIKMALNYHKIKHLPLLGA
ncbi:MAG: DUF1801 domain-containing protein [Gammaproteobacteria bacterium]|nr:DUF1801 domain-containing protein [Gammaproteobacteria bacterium]MDH5728982.1 DUF1801 domain-containing protein [Gammaproteobacteria bacterium]